MTSQKKIKSILYTGCPKKKYSSLNIYFRKSIFLSRSKLKQENLKLVQV